MYTLPLVKKSLLTFLVEGNHIITKYSNREGLISKYYGVILNILFSLVLSIPIGLLVMFAELVIYNFLKFEVLLNQKNPYLYMFLPSCVLVLLFFTSFIVLNLDRKKDLSVPFVIYFVGKLFLKIRFFTELRKAIAFLVFITVATVSCLAFILDAVKIPFSNVTPMLGSIFLISFLLSISFYSQMTLNIYNRQLRQFTMFFIMFILSTFWGFYQFAFYLSGQMNLANTLNVAVLVFSLVGSLPTVLDKGRDFLESLKVKYKETIKQDWEKLITDSNEKRIAVTERFIIFKKNIKEIQLAWQKGNKEKVKMITFFLIYFSSVYAIFTYGPAVMFLLQRELGEAFQWIKSILLTIPLVKENINLATVAIMLLLAIGYSIWQSRILVRIYGLLTWYGRAFTLGKILFATMFIPLFICILFPGLPRQVINISLPIFIMLALISSLLKLLKKKYKSDIDYFKVGLLLYNLGHYQTAYENFKLSSEIGVRKEESLQFMKECENGVLLYNDAELTKV